MAVIQQFEAPPLVRQDNLVAFLNSGAGPSIGQLVAIEKIVPAAYKQWRPFVRDAVAFVFEHLSEDRLTSKIFEQMELPAKTRPEVRLLRLISKMPALQKIGQVLARNRHLAPSVRRELSKLENGISDVTPAEMLASINEQLGRRLKRHKVEIEPAIFSEASVSAVVRFTWWNPEIARRERGVFKVLKPHVPQFFAEDMGLLKQLGVFLTSRAREYRFAVRDVGEVIDESRLLLEHELDFPREQAILLEAARMYKHVFGIRVPRLIKPLCAPKITAMTEEAGVKVTDAFRESPIRRARIAEQLVAGLLSIPLFSRKNEVIFHTDPHAGNLLYDEKRRELVILDWALAQRISLSSRRHLAMYIAMMVLRNKKQAADALRKLAAPGGHMSAEQSRVVSGCIEQLFRRLGPRRSPTVLEAMQLMDEMALNGVRFPAVLAMFRKALFTLDGVLYDVAGAGVRLDSIIARDYITGWLASFGTSISPLSIRDWMTIQGSAITAGVGGLLSSLSAA